MDFFNFIEEQTKWYQNKSDALLDARCEMRMHMLGWKASKASMALHFISYSCQQTIQTIKSLGDKFSNRERVELTKSLNRNESSNL